MPSAAALRAAVFALSAKNLRGGGAEINPPPPPGVRVLNSHLACKLWSMYVAICTNIFAYKLEVI